MKSLFFDGEKLLLTDTSVPQKENEALIRVLSAGICQTDIEITKGYMDFKGILGHEFVGIVEKSPTNELIGKRVTGEINIGCGKCSYCLSGMDRHCPFREVLGIYKRNGAFAEYLTLPERNLHLIPKDIPNEKAIFIEPLAAVLEIFEQVHIQPEMSIFILGDGRLGCLTSMVFGFFGNSITLIGKHTNKIEKVRDFVVDYKIIPDLPSKKADMVIECTGDPKGFDMALNLLKPRGIMVLKSTYQGNINTSLTAAVINEITIIGSRCGPFAPAIRLLQNPAFNPQILITSSFNLVDGLKAFGIAENKDQLKIILNME